MSGIEIEKICVICNDQTHEHYDVHTKSCYGVNEIVYENTYGGVIKKNAIRAVPVINENYGSILVNFNANFDNFNVNNTTLTVPKIRAGIGLEPIALPDSNPNDGQILKYDGQNKKLYWGTDVFGGDGDSGSINNIQNLLVNQDLTIGRNIFIENDISVNGTISLYGDISANNLFLRGDASLNNLFIKQDISANNIIVNNNLDVISDISLAGIFTCYQDISAQNIFLNNDLSVNNIFVGNDMSINNVLINSNLFVENDVSINGNILTYGDISGHDASFSDLSSNRLYVIESFDTKQLTVSEDLVVTKDTRLNESLTCGDGVTPVAATGKLITPDGVTITFL